MIITVTGVEHRKGTFPDKKTGEIVDFDNIQIYFIGPIQNPTKEGFAVGKASMVEKLKNDKDVISAVFGFVPTADYFKSMVGKDYEFYYNQKGKLDMIKPYDPPAAKKGA